jgi:hypothetical protein
MEEKRKPVLKEKWRMKKKVPYMVQRRHFDQTFLKFDGAKSMEGLKQALRRGAI